MYSYKEITLENKSMSEVNQYHLSTWIYWIDDQSKLIWKEEGGNSSSFECAYVLLYKLNI